MCGFVGTLVLNGERTDQLVLERMGATIRHRGPDGDGQFISGPVGFGFRRLAIIDLSPAGNQPMVSEDGRLALVFNGEIYNYVELRDELRSLGHVFRSNSDTEVLLRAYEQWGYGCLRKFNGMWAFLLYDGREGKIFGARDRIGKKPLYYYRTPDAFYFASEIKAILASGRYKGEMNWRKVSRFLLSESFDRVPEDGQTFYTGIEQLPAGMAFELSLKGHLSTWSYWSLDSLPDVAWDPSSPAESFYTIFEDSIRLRLRSDVPIGVFLSGGIDSTAIACVVSKLREKTGDQASNPVLAFSFTSPECDESPYIRETLHQTGIKVVPVETSLMAIWNSMDAFLWHQDEPVHSVVALITYELSRLAAQNGVKVILNGGGSDEYLAGYVSFFRSYWNSLMANGSLRNLWMEVSAYCAVHGGEPTAVMRGCIRHALRSEMNRVHAYRELKRIRRNHAFGKQSWFREDLADYIREDKVEFQDPALDSALKRSLSRAPLPLYLRVEDRNSMAHSVEARMPFLDHRLVALSFRLPPNWKMRGPWNKFVLREAMRGRIPECVRACPEKRGFPVPVGKWFATTLRDPVNDLLNSRSLHDWGIFRVTEIQKDFERHVRGEADVSKRLFNVIQFDLWARQVSKLCGNAPVRPQ